MKSIISNEELNNVITSFFRKGCLTNNFILLDHYQHYLNNRKLWLLSSKNNSLFLLDKQHFYQLYFYLNDLAESFEHLPNDKPIVMEILYRGHQSKPNHLIKYWTSHGFQEHLSRDNMILNLNNITLPSYEHKRIQIKYATSPYELAFSKELFDNTLDKYTGDRLSEDELRFFMENNNLLSAYYDNHLAGILQFEVKNHVIWLGHLAVHPDYRGLGIANALVESYILLNRNEQNNRYSLWVIQDNLPAIRLYRKFGFVYNHKSTVSMLKIS
jgi:ribosomal protein S18 acetylase RimI-like enzyme